MAKKPTAKTVAKNRTYTVPLTSSFADGHLRYDEYLNRLVREGSIQPDPQSPDYSFPSESDYAEFSNGEIVTPASSVYEYTKGLQLTPPQGVTPRGAAGSQFRPAPYSTERTQGDIIEALPDTRGSNVPTALDFINPQSFNGGSAQPTQDTGIQQVLPQGVTTRGASGKQYRPAPVVAEPIGIAPTAQPFPYGFEETGIAPTIQAFPYGSDFSRFGSPTDASDVFDTAPEPESIIAVEGQVSESDNTPAQDPNAPVIDPIDSEYSDGTIKAREGDNSKVTADGSSAVDSASGQQANQNSDAQIITADGNDDLDAAYDSDIDSAIVIEKQKQEVEALKTMVDNGQLTPKEAAARAYENINKIQKQKGSGFFESNRGAIARGLLTFAAAKLMGADTADAMAAGTLGAVAHSAIVQEERQQDFTDAAKMYKEGISKEAIIASTGLNKYETDLAVGGIEELKNSEEWKLYSKTRDAMVKTKLSPTYINAALKQQFPSLHTPALQQALEREAANLKSLAAKDDKYVTGGSGSNIFKMNTRTGDVTYLERSGELTTLATEPYMLQGTQKDYGQVLTKSAAGKAIAASGKARSNKNNAILAGKKVFRRDPSAGAYGWFKQVAKPALGLTDETYDAEQAWEQIRNTVISASIPGNRSSAAYLGFAKEASISSMSTVESKMNFLAAFAGKQAVLAEVQRLATWGRILPDDEADRIYSAASIDAMAEMKGMVDADTDAPTVKFIDPATLK